VLHVYVDADACPVKTEIYRVAKRHGLEVTVVSNSWIRVPMETWITLQVVGDEFDAADDWIVEHATANDIVISGDIPLAARCIENGAIVLGPRGRVLDEDSIGDAVASRDLQTQLRDVGVMTGGPSPFGPRDRSRFLQRLDEIINAIRRRR
jgi:uncharacterized protein YaiI (UPF0178 family)